MAISTMGRLLTTKCGTPGYVTCHVATWIWNIVPLTLLLVGTCGNLLSIAVLCRRNMRKRSTSVYITFLSMSDLCFLYSSVLNTSFKKIFGLQLELRSAFNCAVAEFMIYASGTFSLYLLLLLTIERSLYTKFPFFARAKITRNNAIIITSATLLFVLLLTAHLIFGRELYEVRSEIISAYGNETTIAVQTKCSPVSAGYIKFYLTWWGYIVLLVINFIPLILIVIGNVIIALTLFQQGRKVKPNIPSQTTNTTNTAPITKQAQRLGNPFMTSQEATTSSHVVPNKFMSHCSTNSELTPVLDIAQATALPQIKTDKSTASNNSIQLRNKTPSPSKNKTDVGKTGNENERQCSPTRINRRSITVVSKGQLGSQEGRSNRIRAATKLLFIMSTFSVCTVTPFCSFNIYMKRLKPEDLTYSRLAADQLLFSIIYCLVLSNFALNFFWYFITGTLFKNELKKMVRDAKKALSQIFTQQV